MFKFPWSTDYIESNKSKANTNSKHDQPRHPHAYKSKYVDFKIHIAIDFGTDGCALAYLYNDEVIVYNKWKTNKGQRPIKAKSQILLNEKNQVVAFGDNAKIIYSGLSGDEKITWKIFDRFKMSLYGAETTHKAKHAPNIKIKQRQKLQKVPLSACLGGFDAAFDIQEMRRESMNRNEHKQQAEYLTSLNNNICSADIVFINAFKRLHKTAAEFMAKIVDNDKIRIKDEEIQYIITVPSIWSERAKSKMKEWVIKAGLVDPHVIDQCLIVYEPDCAALAMFDQIKQESLKHNNTEHIDDNERKQRDDPSVQYIMMDLGGGTVDIVCHKIVDCQYVEEIHYPTGGKWGASYIDDVYIKLLNQLFDKQWIDLFKRKAPNGYLEILDRFQTAKLKFYKTRKLQNAKTHSVELPFTFVQFLYKRCSLQNIRLENKLQKCEEAEIVYTKDEDDDTVVYLVLSIDLWKKLFDEIINKIITHMEDLLSVKKIKTNCKYLCLVGGFASSKYLQLRMKDTFGTDSKYNLTVIIAKKPSLSVVTGAALYGKRRDFICARILKYTYGIDTICSIPFAKQLKLSAGYIKKHTVITDTGLCVEDCFKIIAKKGSRIAINTPIVITTEAMNTISSIPVYCSKDYNPITIHGAKKFATLRINTADGSGSLCVIRCHFYGTMFAINAYPENHPEEMAEIQIHYGM